MTAVAVVFGALAVWLACAVAALIWLLRHHARQARATELQVDALRLRCAELVERDGWLTAENKTIRNENQALSADNASLLNARFEGSPS